MSKEDQKVNIEITLNKEAIRSAMLNADRPHEASLAVETVNPRNLRIDDEVYQVVLKPITYKPGTKVPKAPETVKHAAINAIVVDSLTRSPKPDHITVNGSLDISLKGGGPGKLEDVYVANEETARAVARIYTEVMLEKAEQIEDRIQQEKDFLRKQIDDDRY